MDLLHMAGGSALVPQGLPAAAVVMDLAGLDGFRPRLLVHIGQHEHLAGLGLLGDDRHQAVAFCEIGFEHGILAEDVRAKRPAPSRAAERVYAIGASLSTAPPGRRLYPIFRWGILCSEKHKRDVHG